MIKTSILLHDVSIKPKAYQIRTIGVSSWQHDHNLRVQKQAASVSKKKNTSKKERAILLIKKLLRSSWFQSGNKISNDCFTRKRKLPFPLVCILILQKSVKSMQLVLNEVFMKLGLVLETASSSAFTQARHKLLHTAYIELNKRAIVDIVYSDDTYKRYRGFRVLAIDGSEIVLPNEPEVIRMYGSRKVNNQYEKGGFYGAGRASVCYDVFNGIILDSILAHGNAYEVNLALDHLDFVNPESDLLTFDRGYPSYLFLSTLVQKRINFVGRCSRGSFKEAQRLFKHSISSTVVTLRPNSLIKKEIKSRGLPDHITVRFVRVVLSTGEVEVLVTSLLDEDDYPSLEFKEIYAFRWGVETFYGLIKERLCLENFTGKTAESVRQDFYATIFISNLESLFTEETNKELEEKGSKNKYSQQVNRAVSFNTIKNYAIDLFYKEEDITVILGKMTHLFKLSTVCRREGRSVPRAKYSDRRSRNYYKRRKKANF
jgi:hypothetical protein